MRASSGSRSAAVKVENGDLERNQFGRKSGQPPGLPLGISVFDHEVAALDVTEVTQPLTEGLVQVGTTGQVERQVAYARLDSPPSGLVLEALDSMTSTR